MGKPRCWSCVPHAPSLTAGPVDVSFAMVGCMIVSVGDRDDYRHSKRVSAKRELLCLGVRRFIAARANAARRIPVVAPNAAYVAARPKRTHLDKPPPRAYDSILSLHGAGTHRMAIAANLGFPRIGIRRDLKRAVEEYWAGNLDPEELQATAAELRRRHWQLQRSLGVEHIPSNDFSLYDHVLDTAAMLGAVPKRFGHVERDGRSGDLLRHGPGHRGNPPPRHDQVVRHELPLPCARVRAGHEVQARLDQAHRPVSRGARRWASIPGRCCWAR